MTDRGLATDPSVAIIRPASPRPTSMSALDWEFTTRVRSPRQTKSPATRLKNPLRRGGAAQVRATSLAIAAMQALAFDPG